MKVCRSVFSIVIPYFFLLPFLAISVDAFAQNMENQVRCEGYEPDKPKLPTQSVGLNLQKAFEAYAEGEIDESISILLQTNPNNDFDRAYIYRFIGNLMANKQGQGTEALKYLTQSAESKQLNDNDQASLLILVADLSIQEGMHNQALDYYGQWMTLTCRDDTAVYIRLANTHCALKQYNEAIKAADKAITRSQIPDSTAYVIKLSSLLDQNMFNEAKQVAEKLVELFPEDEQWLAQLKNIDELALNPSSNKQPIGTSPIVRIAPRYPASAARDGLEGWVEMQFTVNEAGSVENIVVINATPNKVFNDAAINALKKWKYKPLIENGIPRKQESLTVRLDFKLDR